MNALLVASRALVGVAARSLAVLPVDLTLAQYRALVVLASRGPLSTGALAEILAVHPSTVTRLVDRLVTKQLVLRRIDAADRRTTRVELARKGRAVVQLTVERRRHEIATVVSRLDGKEFEQIVAALTRFAVAAGEAADDSWALGWEVS